MRLTFRGVRSVQVNPGNGEWTVAAQAPEAIVSYRMNSRTFYVILPAQPVDPIRSGCIRIELGGRSSLLSLPEEIDGRPFRTLEQGKETVLRLRIQKKEESWADGNCGSTESLHRRKAGGPERTVNGCPGGRDAAGTTAIRYSRNWVELTRGCVGLPLPQT